MDRASRTDEAVPAYRMVEVALMFISRPRTNRVHRFSGTARLVMLLPLLLTILAACGNGTGGGPAY